MESETRLVRFGIGGPVGSGKSHLLLRLCRALSAEYSIVAITNDIYSREDAQFLTREHALDEGRIVGVETGGCPHAAIRDDISVNLDALTRLREEFLDAGVAFIESGGDNLAATFSPDLVDFQIYVIDVAQGGDIPRKGGLGINQSDLLIVNKIDLAPFVEVDLAQMSRDVQHARGSLPFVMANMKDGTGVDDIIKWVRESVAAAPIKKAVPSWAGDGDDHAHSHSHSDSHSHSHTDAETGLHLSPRVRPHRHAGIRPPIDKRSRPHQLQKRDIEKPPFQ